MRDLEVPVTYSVLMQSSGGLDRFSERCEVVEVDQEETRQEFAGSE